jgi:hypothetical protein
MNDLVDEIQDQFWGFVHLAQERVIDALGWLAEPDALENLLGRFTCTPDA